MKDKILYITVGVLLLVCLGQGYYIHAQTASSAPATADEWLDKTEKWHRQMQEQLRRGEPLSPQLFDQFFNDDFFGRKFNPFDEIQRMRRRMDETFKETDKSMFDNSWNNWFAERIGMDDFKVSVSSTDKNVVVSIAIPGMNTKSASIDVNEDRIKIAFSATNVREDKKSGGVMRSESSQSYTKILPLPPGAVPGTGRTTIEKDRIVVTFDRKK